MIIGILIPFFGTTLGSFIVFFTKKNINKKLQNGLLGFASGVMIAASVWSLLIPAIDMADNQGIIAWFPATVGFLSGIIFLLVLERVTTHLDFKRTKHEGIKSKFKKTKMMILAVTLHNIPEGMAVGIAFAGVLIGNTGITFNSAIALSIGVAVQNFPEGAIISIPLKNEGNSKTKAFLFGVLSGIVEPIGAAITIFLTSLIVPVLPFLLSFAAGAMIYVVVKALIHEAHKDEHSNMGVIGVAVGFIIMMILDVALG